MTEATAGEAFVSHPGLMPYEYLEKPEVAALSSRVEPRKHARKAEGSTLRPSEFHFLWVSFGSQAMPCELAGKQGLP